MAEKLYYTMGEVAEMFDVNQSLLRHWEAQFSILRPKRNKKGNRLFTPRDIEHLKMIYHLVKERGMTLEGARKALRQAPVQGGMDREAELTERLQRIRALLVEVREELREDGSGVVVAEASEAAEEPDAATPDAGQSAARRPRPRPVVKIREEADRPADGAPRPAARKPRAKKDDSGSNELFAFYEQSLF